jgi:lipoate-protein ligase A
MKINPRKTLMWINDVPRNAVMNMALDEMLFDEFDSPVLRVYYWDESYTTIGYFQKAIDVPVHGFVRRFTGGLTVNHNSDISYCFIVSSDFWNVYDHCRSYRNIHLVLQKVLQRFGINSVILNKKTGYVNSICIQTFCENDLIFYGKKIVGSCSRRRGNKLIIQGSIHINLDIISRKKFSKEFASDLAMFIKVRTKSSNFSIDDIKYANKIINEKYSNSKWNNKF